MGIKNQTQKGKRNDQKPYQRIQREEDSEKKGEQVKGKIKKENQIGQ